MKTKAIQPVVIASLLLISALMLSSWKSPTKNFKGFQDTTKKVDSKKKNATYSRKTIITFDENGEPHESITEGFEGDEGLRNLMHLNIPFDINMPALPDLNDLEVPGFPPDFDFPFMPDDAFQLDSIDWKKFHFDEKDFEGFNDEMSALMKERFESMGPEFEASMERMQEQLKEMDFEFYHDLDGLNKNLEEEMERLHETLRNDPGINWNSFDNDNGLDVSGSWTKRVKEFEAEAQKELVSDGYLDSTDKIESISWSEDEIKFNGKPINPKHTQKYRELREKYLKSEHSGRPE